jgi:hypothetical protein
VTDLNEIESIIRRTSHGEGAALVAGVDEEADVRIHEVRAHGQVRAVGGHELGVRPELLHLPTNSGKRRQTAISTDPSAEGRPGRHSHS